MTWQPGQSGNPSGLSTQEQKPFLAALKRAIAQDNADRIRKTVENLMDLAAEGKPWAVMMLADRLDGKPGQEIEHKGAQPVQIVGKLGET
jgi:hypothetical protein